MSEILLLNARRKVKRRAKAKTKRRPAKKRRTTKKTVARRVTARKKGALTMAKKRTAKRRAPRRNPTRARRRPAKRIARRASSSVAGLNVKGALKNVPMTTIGMFAAKWAAKRFGEAATETDPASWNYASYLKGALGAAVAGFAANMVKRGTGQRVLEGGLSLMAYKLVENELIANSPFWSGQLGADEEGRYPGVIEENDEGTPFILGDDNQWYPLDEADRMHPAYMGDTLVEPGPLGFGDALTTPGPLGMGSDLDDLYRKSFINR